MQYIKRISFFFREYTFLFLATLLVVSFSLSEAFLSISAGFIFLQFFFTGNWGYKKNVLKSDTSLWALICIYVVFIIGIFFCRDWETGIYELKKNAFWVLIPLGVATSSRISSRDFWRLLLIFALFVTLSTFIAAFKIVFQEQFRIVDVRDASFVSHVDFSFQIILTLFIIIYSLVKEAGAFNKISPYIKGIWLIWLMFFLLFQKSLLGMLALYAAAIYFVTWITKLIRSKVLHLPIFGLAIAIFILPLIYIAWVYYDFHKDLDSRPIEPTLYTINGNAYTFDFEDRQKENGHFVNWYICKEELETAWNAKSEIKLYDKGANGYQIYFTLIRYLTSKGLMKDASGVNALSDKDIKRVQGGISNYIYAEKKYSLYPRIYETVWEMNEYKRTGNPNNQSLSQRIEYVKAAKYIIKNNLWGIGTGNYKLAFANAYKQIDTKLDMKFRFHVHNQYLSYMVKFGVLGLISILLLIFHSINNKHQFKNILLVVLVIIIMVSNFGEAILETHVGLSFFVFFLSLFLWHSPDELK